MSSVAAASVALAMLATTSTAYAQQAAKPDADMKAVLDAQQALGAKPIESLTPADARLQPTVADGVIQVLRAQGRPIAPDPTVMSKDMTYPAGDGMPQNVRIYTPAGATGPLPVVLYFHGGGFVIANIGVYDSTPRAIAQSANCIVVSAEYRKAPEHKFPAAHDDANAAYRWVLDNASSFGGDPKRVAIAGESAGGNLAVNVGIHARDHHLRAPSAILAVYPVAGSDMNTPSYVENASAKPLNKPMMAWFVHYYLKDMSQGMDPRINLVAAKLDKLPPTTIITDQIDPLRSEGQLLAQRMQAAGDQVAYRNYDGVTHEFFGTGKVVRKAYEANQFAADQLKTAFAMPMAH